MQKGLMFMKAQTLAIELILTLAFSFLFYGIIIQPVESQTFETIYIKADGSVEGTSKIQRQENVYTLINNIFGTVEVEKDDIVIDGSGYTLQGRGIDEIGDERGIYLKGLGWGHPGCGNVSVKNFRISNFLEGIYVVGGRNNSIVGNFLENASLHVLGSANLTGDLIKHNTIKDSWVFIDYNLGGIDVVTENNFIACGIYVGLSVAPVVDRNYWSDYLEKYPDAEELGDSGIWDTPYIDDRYEEDLAGSGIWISCIDYHPLISPVDIPEFPDSTMPTAEPSSSPTPSPSPSPESTTPTSPTPLPSEEPQPIGQDVILGVAVTVAVLVAGLGLLVYLIKRK